MGECHLWQGPKDRCGRPITHFKGVPVRLQHVIWQKKYGKAPTKIKMTCGMPHCLNIEHMEDIIVVYNQEVIETINQGIDETTPTR